MKNKKGQKLFLCLSILLLTIAATHILFPHLNNWKLRKAGADNTYLQYKPLPSGDLLWEELSNWKGSYYGGIGENSTTQVVIPKEDIPYYASPGDSRPIYVMKAGHTNGEVSAQGYGFTPWPTYSHEWRYARPFSEIDLDLLKKQEYGYEQIRLEELPYGYVKYADLKNLAYYPYCPDIPNIISGKLADWDPTWRLQFDLLDKYMYEIGYYYSPNLHILIFDTWNLAFLAAGLLLFGITLFWMHKSRKRDVVSQELVKKIPGKKN